MNGQVLTNPAVKENLDKLAYGLDAAGYPDAKIVVTGGSSKWDAEYKASVSMVDGRVIPERDKTSAHNLLSGARDVDIRGSALGNVTPKELFIIVEKYTDFNRKAYYEDTGHFHFGLPKSFSCYRPDGC